MEKERTRKIRLNEREREAVNRDNEEIRKRGDKRGREGND